MGDQEMKKIIITFIMMLFLVSLASTGFAITNVYSGASRDVSIAPMGNTSFVLCYVEGGTSGTDDGIECIVYNTTGSAISNSLEIDDDAYGGTGNSRVALTMVNETSAVVALYDDAGNDIDVNKIQLIGSTLSTVSGFDNQQIDGNAGGTYTDVSVTTIDSSSIVVGYVNDGDDDFDYEEVGYTGSSFTTGDEERVDDNMAPSIDADLGEICAYSDTRVAHMWFDDNSNDVSAEVTDGDATQDVIAQYDYDNNAGAAAAVGIACLRDDRVAFAWYVTDMDDVFIGVENFTGDSRSTIKSATQIDDDATGMTAMDVAEIDVGSTSNFVVCWDDQDSDVIKCGIYDESGNQVTAPFAAGAAPDATEQFFDVAGSVSHRGYSFCDSKFVLTWVNSSDQLVFQGYDIDGSEWDGVCDKTGPTVSIDHPTNTTYNLSHTNSTYFFDLLYTTTDANGVTQCKREVNATNTTISNCANATVQFGPGTHTVKIWSNDTYNNWASSSLLTFSIADVTAPNITLNSPYDNYVVTADTILLNFTPTDNSGSAMTCSLYINGTINQTNSSTNNGTAALFNLSFSHGHYSWNISCSDSYNNTNWSNTWSLFVNNTPTLNSVSDSPDPVKGSGTITITASGANDPNNDTLQFFCDTTEAPTAANTDCTGGTTTDTTPPYSLSCTFAVTADDTTHTVYCRVYDGTDYSSVTNTTYTTDSTQPATTVNSVAGDGSSPYYDSSDDSLTNITINGEASMSCRWSETDLTYSDMSNDCSIVGTQAYCEPVTTTQGSDAYNFFVSCKDSVGNEQNSTQNLDITSLITDWAAPTTSDNADTVVQTPGYNVTITEADNVDGDVSTLYCTDAANTCTPNTAIDDGNRVQFTTRGTRYLRYNSTDDAANTQTIASRTIKINQLPVFTSASDDATTIRGGSTVNVSAVAYDPDSTQTITLFVCASDSATHQGCGGTHYCNATGTANISCTFTAESDSASHTWYAFIFDELNESATSNSRSGTYTTDSTSPVITPIVPDNTTYTSENMTAEISLNENSDWAAYCLDACSSNTTMTNISATYWSASMTTLADGTHYIKFYANDTYGNMANSSITYFTIDTSPADSTSPAITIISPTNTTYYANTSVLLNITINENATWAGYSLNGAASQTMDDVTNRKWEKTITGLAGVTQHNITFYVNDSSNNQGNKSVTFFVDISSPTYSNVSATPSTANQSQAVVCSAYWTDTFNITSAKVEENSTGEFENHTITMSGNSGWTNYRIVGSKLTNIGSYMCKFYATDIAGNSNSTSTTFTVQDVVSPSLTIIYPENTTYSQNSVAFEIYSSEALKTAYYCVDSCASNTTMTNTSSTLWQASPTIADGFHAVIFYGNDTSDNIGTASINFSVDVSLGDTTPPTITVQSPVNGTYFTTTTVLLNISLNENGTLAEYTLNSGSLTILDNYTNRNWNTTLTGLEDETQHNITFFANDSSTNKNQGNKSITIFVDIKAPAYSNAQATPSPANVSQSVLCSIDWSDRFNITSVKIAENTTGTYVNHTISYSGSGNANYTLPSLSEGVYDCIFYATDIAGNRNSTNITFNVNDVTAPIISITSPLNTTYNTQTIELNIITNENITNANYTLDSGTVTALTGSGTFWSKTITSVTDGLHTIIVYAKDESNNAANSTVKFSVDTSVLDTTQPVLTIRSPTNNTYYDTSSILFNITSNENLVWAGYSLNDSALQILTNTTLRIWNKTAILNDGTYNITFYANDSAGNQGNTTDNVKYFFIDTTVPQNSTIGYTPSSPTDASTIDCYSNWTDNINLDYGFVEHNATGTFVNSTNISLSGLSGRVNYTFTANSTTPPVIGCRFYAYDKAGNLNKTSMISLSITDTTKPSYVNFTYTPNTTALLDPDVEVNITINATDDRAVNNVSLHYKLTTQENYTVTTFDALSGTGYNGSFLAAVGNWTFYVNVTDTSNNSNTTDIISLTVEDDETWINTTTITTIKSFILNQRSSNNTLGNLTINNTGDYDMNFTVTATSSGNRVTLNNTGNTSIVLQIPYSTSTDTISVQANTTDLAAGTYNYTLTLVATRDNMTVSTQTLNFQIAIQNVAGPLLSVSITIYSSSVAKGDTDVTYSAKVQNLGTSDATNVWLAWTIPEEFLLQTGSLNRSIGNLPIGTIATNTITINVNASSSDVNTTINATSSSNENSTDSASKIVTIGEPTTVTETVTETVTTTLGGGGITRSSLVELTLTGEEILTSTENFELVRGKSNWFPVRVKNIFEKTKLYNVSISIGGYLSQYMTITPSLFDVIGYNETKDFNVTIISPEYMEQGSHELTITITGKIIGVGVRKDLKETRDVTLIIHTITKEETNQSLVLASSYIKEMKDAGFPTTKTSKLLVQAKQALKSGDYETAKDLSDQIKQMKENAFKTHELIQEIRDRMSRYTSATGAFLGVSKDFPETQELINLAIAAFEREDYATALQRARDAQMTLAVESSEYSLFYLLVDYWWLIFVLLGLLSFGIIFGRRLYEQSTITQRILGLEKKEQTIMELMKKNQEKYYKQKSIGTTTFHKAKKQYEGNLRKVKRVITELRHKRIGILKPEDVVKDLGEERNDVIKQMKELQESYFVHGEISRAEYMDQAKVFSERLAEIDDEELTTEELISKKKIKSKLKKEIKKEKKKMDTSLGLPDFSGVKLTRTKIKKPKLPKVQIRLPKISLPKIKLRMPELQLSKGDLAPEVIEEEVGRKEDRIHSVKVDRRRLSDSKIKYRSHKYDYTKEKRWKHE